MAIKLIRPPETKDLTLFLRQLFLRAERQIIDEITRKRAAGYVDYAEVAALERVQKILQDMADTLYATPNGAGLSANQVGILKRLVTIDVEDGNQYVLINPEITEQEGEQTGYEGCLSVPGKTGIVTRPERVRVRALDAEMEPFELEAEGLLARAVCHELAHLDGQLYVELVEGELMDVESEEESGEE